MAQRENLASHCKPEKGIFTLHGTVIYTKPDEHIIRKNFFKILKKCLHYLKDKLIELSWDVHLSCDTTPLEPPSYHLKFIPLLSYILILYPYYSSSYIPYLYPYHLPYISFNILTLLFPIFPYLFYSIILPLSLHFYFSIPYFPYILPLSLLYPYPYYILILYHPLIKKIKFTPSYPLFLHTPELKNSLISFPFNSISLLTSSISPLIYLFIPKYINIPFIIAANHSFLLSMNKKKSNPFWFKKFYLITLFPQYLS